MITLNTASLRHRITIEASTPTQSSSGEKTAEWNPYRSVRASIEPQHGGELDLNAGKGLAATVVYKITTRHVPGVLPSMRIRFGGAAAVPCGISPANLAGMTLSQLSGCGNDQSSERRPRYFAINSVINPEMRNVMLIMMCTEVVIP